MQHALLAHWHPLPLSSAPFAEMKQGSHVPQIGIQWHSVFIHRTDKLTCTTQSGLEVEIALVMDECVGADWCRADVVIVQRESYGNERRWFGRTIS